MKTKIFIAILSLFLLASPVFVACNKQPPETPPLETFNDEASENLDELFGSPFFPFDLVDVTKVNYSSDEPITMISFEFYCEDFVSFKLSLALNLQNLGFVQNSDFDSFSLTKDHVVTIVSIGDTEEGYIFSISTQIQEPSNVELLNQRILEILGFSLDIPETYEVYPLDDGSLLSYMISGVTMDEMSAFITDKLSGVDGVMQFSPVMFLIMTDNGSFALNISSAGQNEADCCLQITA